jgi:hypothetical protein
LESSLIPLKEVKAVISLDSTQFLSLNCFVLGDDPDRFFTVEILKNKNVSILKDLIKEKKAPHLDHVAASDLDLWQVSFPIDDLHSMNPPTVGPRLGSGELLLDVFPSELNIKLIHVTVCVPAKSECYMDSWYNSAHYSAIRGYR